MEPPSQTNHRSTAKCVAAKQMALCERVEIVDLDKLLEFVKEANVNCFWREHRKL